MLTIIFEAHSSSFDNEAQLASGWEDPPLSPKGRKQAKELGIRYKNESFAAIFCSDLKRSFHTAEIAFANKIPIVLDKRLRECNYGDFNRKPLVHVEKEKANRITVPFPNGESFVQSSARIKDFLQNLSKEYDSKKVLIIGHRATQYGLEQLIHKVPLEQIVTAEWKWSPGWTYIYDLNQ